jgi:hypothetical protein
MARLPEISARAGARRQPMMPPAPRAAAQGPSSCPTAPWSPSS